MPAKNETAKVVHHLEACFQPLTTPIEPVATVIDVQLYPFLSNQKLVRCSIFNIQHSNFECRISNIKLNPTFKSNVKYRISNSIQHSYRMSNIEYQTKSNIQIEYRISN